MRAYALVDPADFEALNAWRWSLSGPEGYAYRSETRRVEGGKRTLYTVRMHRQLMGLDRGDPRQVDHFNGNRLDNRRTNLRIVAGMKEQHQNRRANRGARSRFRGVSRQANGTWQATLKTSGTLFCLGTFDLEEEAAKVAAAERARRLPYSREASTLTDADLAEADQICARYAERRRPTSRHRGVSWDKRRNKWYAYISVNNKTVNLGAYLDEQDAADAVQAYRVEHGLVRTRKTAA